MKTALPLALSLLAGTMYGETAIDGPRAGYIATGAGVRSVLGILGAARLGDPVVKELRNVAVVPGAHTAFGVDGAGRFVRADLRDGSVRDMNLGDVASVTASPGGKAVLAIAGDSAHAWSEAGERLRSFALPAKPLSVAASDAGSAVLISAAEGDGEVLYLLDENGAHRLLQARRFPALAFLPNSDTFFAADETGAIFKAGADLNVGLLTTLPGTRALAGTMDGSRLLAVAERAVHSVQLATGEQTATECGCTASMARPLGNGSFLLSSGEEGPIWALDASGSELRAAFIPEAAHE